MKVIQLLINIYYICHAIHAFSDIKTISIISFRLYI